MDNILKVGNIVFSRGSILEKYLILLRKAKKLDRSVRIESSLNAFGRATITQKRESIQRIKKFLRLKPAFNKFQILEQRERIRVRKLIKRGKNPNLARLKMLDKKGDRMLRRLNSSEVFFI